MQNYMGLAPHVTGTVDVDAMADAFDALLQAHPILNAHLERRSDGRHQFVVTISSIRESECSNPPQGQSNGAEVHLDQYVSLINLDVRLDDRGAELCLYLHHSLADAHHQFALAHQLFGFYTDLVCAGGIGDVSVNPAPESLEMLLAERGIQKKRRSGFERDHACDVRLRSASVEEGSDRRCPDQTGFGASHAVLADGRGNPGPDGAMPGEPGEPQHRGLGGDPPGGVADPGNTQHPDSVCLSCRLALPPFASGRRHREHQSAGCCGVSCRDRVGHGHRGTRR